MSQMKSQDISRLVNEAYYGIEGSCLGKIIEEKGDGSKQVNTLPMQAFLTVLCNILPKDIQGGMKIDG